MDVLLSLVFLAVTYVVCRALDEERHRQKLRMGYWRREAIEIDKLLSEERVAEIRERHSKATPGPWRQGKFHDGAVSDHLSEHITEELVEVYGGEPVADVAGSGDHEFVIHSWQDIKDLLADREALKRLIAELEKDH